MTDNQNTRTDREAIAKEVYQAMVWAAQQAPPPNGVYPPYWHDGNSDAETEARRAADAVLSLIPEAGWRDISTAPKDGTRILIYVPPEEDYDPEIQYVAYWNGEKWEEALGEGYTTFEPTHWMPRPPAPTPDHPRLDYFRGFEACREQAAQVIEQCNREGPYEEIGAAQKIRDIPTPPHKSGYVTYAETAPDPVKAAAGVLLREWQEHGEGLQGELTCHSPNGDNDGSVWMEADIDGEWVKFEDVTIALRALEGEA